MLGALRGGGDRGYTMRGEPSVIVGFKAGIGG